MLASPLMKTPRLQNAVLFLQALACPAWILAIKCLPHNSTYRMVPPRSWAVQSEAILTMHWRNPVLTWLLMSMPVLDRPEQPLIPSGGRGGGG